MIQHHLNQIDLLLTRSQSDELAKYINAIQHGDVETDQGMSPASDDYNIQVFCHLLCNQAFMRHAGACDIATVASTYIEGASRLSQEQLLQSIASAFGDARESLRFVIIDHVRRLSECWNSVEPYRRLSDACSTATPWCCADLRKWMSPAPAMARQIAEFLSARDTK